MGLKGTLGYNMNLLTALSELLVKFLPHTFSFLMLRILLIAHHSDMFS
jgi:hypothetical protein